MLSRIRPRFSTLRLTRQHRKAFSTDSRAEGKGEGASDSSSTGKYSSSREVGNPIAWANPTGGATMDDHTSNVWRWVFPIGAGLIFLGCYMNGRKHSNKDEKIVDRSARLGEAMRRLDYHTGGSQD